MNTEQQGQFEYSNTQTELLIFIQSVQWVNFYNKIKQTDKILGKKAAFFNEKTFFVKWWQKTRR